MTDDSAAIKILLWPAVDAERLSRIVEAAGRARVVNAQTAEQAAAEMVDADGFIGKLTAALLGQAGRLRWVQSPTASLEHYVFPELVEHPAQLTNMRGLFSDVIADHVLGYILCFARNLHHYLRRQAERTWAPCGGENARGDFAAGPGVVNDMDRAHRHLSDQTLGVVGLGHIGREIARRGAAFQMRILGLDPYAEPPENVELYRPDQLHELLGQCDYVAIAAPHTPETAGMFGEAEFDAMRDDAVLINIGRGVIVQLDPLTVALQRGRLGGAALDVFETEPLPADHPLWALPNVILTPHVAACSPRVAERHLATLLENVRRFTRDEPLMNVVDKRLWF